MLELLTLRPEHEDYLRKRGDADYQAGMDLAGC